MVNKKSIAVFTTGRQDWGILSNVAAKMAESPSIDVTVLAGGMACSDDYGNIASTIDRAHFLAVESLKWKIAADSGVTVAEEIASIVVIVEKVLLQIKPDVVMLLGDRYETLAIAQIATLLRIPIIHLHGGEETTGAVDNQIRHAVSKLSHLHFVSHIDHAERLIRMGENPDSVFNTGAPGLDNMYRKDLPVLSEVLQNFGLNKKDEEPLFLITYHPPTLLGNAEKEITNLLKALNRFSGIYLFTSPNSDMDNMIVRKAINDFVAEHPGKSAAVSALGEKRYWTVLKGCDAVIGNSSSGIIEAPAVPVPVVNVGMRQAGRGFAPCIIDVPSGTELDITNAIEKALDPEFRKNLSSADSRYGEGHSAEKITEIVQQVSFEKLKIKSFYNGRIK